MNVRPPRIEIRRVGPVFRQRTIHVGRLVDDVGYRRDVRLGWLFDHDNPRCNGSATNNDQVKQ